MNPSSGVPLRRNWQFQLLWVGSATSVLGSQISTLAFPLLILAMTGSRAWAGVAGSVAVAANVAVGLPAGALVDRWDRRRTLLICEAVRMVALAVVGLATAGGWVSLPLLIAVAVIQGALGGLVTPIRAVTIRRIVPTEQLPSAYAQEEARAHAAALLGPPAGGALFALGRAIPFLADALSYLVSFGCAAFARIPPRPAGGPARTTSSNQPSNLLHEMREGLRWLRGQRTLSAMIALLPVMNIAGAAVPLLTIVLLESRGVSPAVIGLVLSTEGVAGLLGSLIAARFARALAPGQLLLLIVWSWAVLVVLLALPLNVWLVAAVLGLGVLVTPAMGVVVTTEVARVTPEHLLGRTMATLGTVPMLFNPLGPLLAGILSQAFGPPAALLMFGGYLGVCGLVATLSPHLRTRLRPAAEPAEPAVPTGPAGPAVPTGPAEPAMPAASQVGASGVAVDR